jgi:hypothetical protein
LCEQHGQHSLEELFFALIDQHDDQEGSDGLVAEGEIASEQQL